MEQLKPVDVVIVGGGWTGLAMAKELTSRTNLSVVVLERGPARKLSDYATGMDEVDYSIRKRLMQNIAEETVTHRHTIRDSAVPVRQYGHFLPGTGVGGSGEHWQGVAFRFDPDDFILATRLREKFGVSRLPENLSVQDFGVTYDQMEPYFWRAEQMMGIGGRAGNLKGKLVDGGNIFEGPRSHEYPNPPHKYSYGMTLFEKTALELGYHPFPSPAATLTQDYKNPDGVSRMGCQYCGFCMLYGCMVGAKSQPSNTLMPVLTRKKNFILRTESWARRIVHRNGKAEGVMYSNAKGEEVFQPANVVIMASFTPNNTRLLLLSKIGEPYDPTTGKGTLGKNFTHALSAGGSFVKFDKPLNAFMNAGAQAIRYADFMSLEKMDPDGGIVRGGLGGGGGGGGLPISTFGRVPPGEVSRNWGSDWKKAALQYYDRMATAGGFELSHLAYKHNYLDLDPTYTDKWGDPLLRTTIDWTDHEQRQRARATQIGAKVAETFAKVGGGRVASLAREGARASTRYQTANYSTTHVQGGVIMGVSPDQSAVNTWLQHWQMPNLFVIGASAFPHNSGYHATLTAVALTYRAADGLIDRYLKKPGALA